MSKTSGCPHLDGFRAEIVEVDEKVGVDLLLYQNGEESSRWRLAEFDATEYAAARRFWQLLAAVARFVTLGGDPNTPYAIWDNWPAVDVSPMLPLLSVESEEAYVHTYQLPNGKFLRVYEDETYEELDRMDIHELLEDLVDDEPGVE
jgi:hypothetical protein